MMSLHKISKRDYLRRISPLCTIMAYAFLTLLPIGAAAQVADDPAERTPGLQDLELSRPDEPTIRYAISIPRTYSALTPAPLVLALHFGVRGGDAMGAGASVMRGLIGPALEGLGAVIVAPDSVQGNWSSPENEKAVNALLDMVLANYAIEKTKVVVTGYSMGGAGSWYLAQKFPERFRAAIPISATPPTSATGWQLPVLAIHSRDDEVNPFDPTEARIAELQKAGVQAKLIALNGVSHRDPTRFRNALRQAIPWLWEVWK